MNKLIKTYRKINIFDRKTKKKPNEVFLTIDGINRSFYYYVTLTKEFKEWADRNTFVKPYSIEIIQQRNNKNKFLVKIEETAILGSIWLDYKSKREIERFFKIKI